ncbi:D-ribose pyranase [Pseudorhodoferax sp. Leaf274]|uniref:D-ribose pyranase n=1 Tax=Pseudorhodoferax sp. Leaf274 TaxID=1736318 RepID=UPI000703983C|nr:D-ribose pyranase [Pseudorhodoferax sp. Leaf274]KQP40590.1 ribose pyranase [Pseudorhodoferax sp. Leaf274]
MKRTTLLHAELSRVIAGMGHGDLLVIGDAGLPIPAGPLRIDLAVTRGVPGFAQVLEAVLSELQVERAVIAQEACGPDGARRPAWCAALPPLALELVPHAQFKQLCLGAKAMVRTGECTPYANVLLYAGVAF